MVTADLAEETQTDVGATQAQPAESTVTGPDPDLNEAMTLLEEIDGKATQDGGEEASTESQPAGTEPDELEKDAIEAAVARTAEETRRETEERIRREQEAKSANEEARRQIEGIDSAFRNRAGRLRAHLDAVARGEVDLNVEGVLNEFNAHHGQVAPVTGKAYWDANRAFAKDNLSEADYQALEDGIASGKIGDHFAYLNAIKDSLAKQARNGHYTEAQVREKEALKALSIRRRFETDEAFRNSWLSRIKPAEGRGDLTAFTGRSGPITTVEEALTAPIDRLIADQARRNGQ